jgi:hypothetical protein
MKKLTATLLLSAALVACGSKSKNSNTMPANSGGTTPAAAGSGDGSAAGSGGGSAMTMPMNGSGGATGATDPCAGG